MRKKLALTVIFSLVFFTISITVVRGSIFYQVYSTGASEKGQTQTQRGIFTWFWFYCEFTVGKLWFKLSCPISEGLATGN